MQPIISFSFFIFFIFTFIYLADISECGSGSSSSSIMSCHLPLLFACHFLLPFFAALWLYTYMSPRSFTRRVGYKSWKILTYFLLNNNNMEGNRRWRTRFLNPNEIWFYGTISTMVFAWNFSFSLFKKFTFIS